MDERGAHECTYEKDGVEIVCMSRCGSPVPDDVKKYMRIREPSDSYRHNPSVVDSSDSTFPPAIQKSWMIP